MKQTCLMIVLTAMGTLGPFIAEPFLGVTIYYLFAVLRPQYLWEWALPQVGWSAYVAYATILATGWWLLTSTPAQMAVPDGTRAQPRPWFSFAHKAYFAFGFWVVLTYFTAVNQAVAYQWFLEYLKLFLMFAIASLVVINIRQVWIIYQVATLCLAYIAYEMNVLYFTAGRVDIYRRGYGGLDNNGAGLMLAMGIPLAIYAWEACPKRWRWGFLASVPLLLHSVLMSFSRGAMLSLILCAPVLLLRSNKRKQFSLVLLALASLVPVMAGQEIRARFFTVNEYQTDESANSRFDSWAAAIKIANDYPIFGVGIRNANLMSYAYGADVEGRTIHSQYLQTAADNGWVGLFFYAAALGSTWVAILRTRRALRKRTDADAALARSMLSGVEGSLATFCVGAAFLSLEVFELPYLVAFLGVQISLLMRVRAPAVAPEAIEATPAPVRALVSHPMLS